MTLARFSKKVSLPDSNRNPKTPKLSWCCIVFNGIFYRIHRLSYGTNEVKAAAGIQSLVQLPKQFVSWFCQFALSFQEL
jgi:hypothetical protein